jgi:hypothetical protein
MAVALSSTHAARPKPDLLAMLGKCVIGMGDPPKGMALALEIGSRMSLPLCCASRTGLDPIPCRPYVDSMSARHYLLIVRAGRLAFGA